MTTWKSIGGLKPAESKILEIGLFFYSIFLLAFTEFTILGVRKASIRKHGKTIKSIQMHSDRQTSYQSPTCVHESPPNPGCKKVLRKNKGGRKTRDRGTM